MIKISNITKVYKDKSGSSKIALSDISLSLPDKGLILIVGRNGSGKSTLLNLISGLDSVTSGKIIYNNKNIDSLNRKELNYYRRQIGFIFQDTTLIDNIKVKDNLALAYETIYGKINNDQLNSLINEYNLSEFADRLPYEMSGGQRQKVALAMALIKKPRMILGDEPTDDLDIQSCKDIADELIKLSLEKLVIVVTHDKEHFSSYADRIIELSEGKIVSDTGNNQHQPPLNIQTNCTMSNKLSNRLMFKLCLNNIKVKPVRLAVSIIVATLLIALFAITYSIANYNQEHALVINYKKNNIEYTVYGINDRHMNSYSMMQNCNLPSTYTELIDSQYPSNIKSVFNRYNEYQSYLIGNPEVLGYSLSTNSIPLDDKSCYITDILAYNMLSETGEYMLDTIFTTLPNYYIYEDTVPIGLTTRYSIDDLSGKTIYDYWGNEIITVAGIIITNELDKYKDYRNLDALHKHIIDTKSEMIYFSYFVSPNYSFGKDIYPIRINDKHNYDISIRVDDEQHYIDLINISFLHTSAIILADDHTIHNNVPHIEDQRFNIGSEEIIITLDYYNLVFGTDYRPVDLTYNNIIPEHLGHRVDISITDKSNNSIIHLNNYLIKGIAISNSGIKTDFIYLNEEELEGINSTYPYYINAIIIPNDISNRQMLNLINIAYRYDLSPIGIMVYIIFSYSESSPLLAKPILYAQLMLLLITTLIISLIIASNIKNNKKIIGFLRAQGVNMSDIIKIYILEGLLIAMVISILSLILFSIGIYLLNIEGYKVYLPNVDIYQYNIFSFILAFIIPYIIIVLSSIIPLLKLYKSNPIDVIKKL